MNKQNWIFSTSITPLPAQSKIGLCSGSDVFHSLSCKTLILPLLANWFFCFEFFPLRKNIYTTYIHYWIQFFPKQMGFLTWIFLPQKKWHLSKLNILDFLPAMQMNWNFSLANFSRVDGMLFSIHFIFMFLYRKTICDNEKRHSVNLDHGKCKSQKQTRNVQWVTQTDKWKHSNVLCTCTM